MFFRNLWFRWCLVDILEESAKYVIVIMPRLNAIWVNAERKTFLGKTSIFGEDLFKFALLWAYSMFFAIPFFLLPCIHALQCINLIISLRVPGLRRYGSRSSSRKITFRVSQQERLPLLVVKRCKSLPCRCDNAFGKQADQTATKRYSVVAPESTGLWGDSYI